MTHRVSLYLLLSVALGAIGCQANGPEFESTLRVAMPLGAEELEYVKIEAAWPDGGQSHERIGTPDDGDLELFFEVPADTEVSVFVTLFDLREAVGFYALEGDTSLTTTSGEQTVELEAIEMPSVSTTITTLFDDDSLLGTSVELDLLDDTTGYAETGAFSSQQPFELPVGRVFVVGGTNPFTGAAFEQVVTVDDTGVVDLDLGSPPAEPTGTPSTDGSGVLADDIQHDTAYAIQCAFGTSCAAPDIEWQTCDASMNDYIAGAPLEGTGDSDERGVMVRYPAVSGSCVVLDLDYDLTPPQASVELDPGFIPPGGVPSITAKISANEALRPDTVDQPDNLTIDAYIGGTLHAGDLCAATLEVVDDPWSALVCVIDTAGWGEGIYTLVANGSDLAGNRFTTTVPLTYLEPTPAPAFADIRVTEVRPFPQVPSPVAYHIPILVELTNIGLQDAQQFSLGPVQLIPPTVPPPSDFMVGIGTLPVPATGFTAQGSLQFWVVLENQGWTGSWPEEGEYRISFELSWTGHAPVTYEFPITMQIPPARWLTNDTLHLSELLYWELPASAGGFYEQGESLEYPITGGVGDTGCEGQCPWQFVADDPSLLSVDPGYNELRTHGIGETVLTLTNLESPNVDQDAVPVKVWPAAPLAVLQDLEAAGPDRVLVYNTVNETMTPHLIDEAIGRPLGLLWESTRNQLIAYGDAGVVVDAAGGTAAVAPCAIDSGAGDLIIDAAVTAAAPGHRNLQPDIALLVQRGTTLHHCEISGHDGSDLFDAEHQFACPAQQLVSDPITGEHAVIGNGSTPCARVYHTRDSTISYVPSTVSPDLGWAGTVREAVYDPYGNFALTLADDALSGTKVAAGWSLGASQTPRPGALPGTQGMGPGSQVTAIGMDLLTRRPIVGMSVASTGIYREVHFYKDRVGASWAWELATLNDSVDTSAIATDSSHRRLYLATDNGPGQSPSWTLAGLDEPFSTLHGTSRTTTVGGAGRIVAMAVAGAQPLSLSSDVALVGDVLTLHGVGFAGFLCEDPALEPRCADDSLNGDHVVVAGVEAPILRSSPTSITFEIPPDFELLDRELYNVGVRVLSHGVISGRAAGMLRIKPRPLGYAANWDNSGEFFSCTSACNGGEQVLAGPLEDIYIANSNGVTLLNGGGELNFGGMPGPTTMTASASGQRGIGHVNTGSWDWYDVRLPDIWFFGQPPPNEVEPEQRFPMAPELTLTADPGVMANHPDGAALAIAVGEDVHFVWATGMSPHPAGRVSGVVAAGRTAAYMSFDRGGDTLFITDDQGAVSAVTMTDPPAPVAGWTRDNDGSCPSSPGVPLALAAGDSTSNGMLLRWHPAEEILASWELWEESGAGWVESCLSSGPISPFPLGLGDPDPIAAISPAGDLIAVAASYQGVDFPELLLFDPHDLGRLPDRFGLFIAWLDSMETIAFSRSGQYVRFTGWSTEVAYYGSVNLWDVPISPDAFNQG